MLNNERPKSCKIWSTVIKLRQKLILAGRSRPLAIVIDGLWWLVSIYFARETEKVIK